MISIRRFFVACREAISCAHILNVIQSPHYSLRDVAMTQRAMNGLTPPPSTRKEVERVLFNLKRSPELSAEQLAALDRQVQELFPGGFDHRDEANAIIAMAVRNGPIENLHAGESSALLEDDTLSRLTDDEIKAIMIYATRTVALMLRLRDECPDIYREYLQAYASRYCRSWERSS